MMQSGNFYSKKKHFVFLLLILGQLIVASHLYAQSEEPSYMIRCYEDDDFFSDFGAGTDHAYSSGLQINFYFNNNKTPRFFLNRWLPKAGDSCVNTYSLGLMQLLYTPDSI